MVVQSKRWNDFLKDASKLEKAMGKSLISTTLGNICQEAIDLVQQELGVAVQQKKELGLLLIGSLQQ